MRIGDSEEMCPQRLVELFELDVVARAGQRLQRCEVESPGEYGGVLQHPARSRGQLCYAAGHHMAHALRDPPFRGTILRGQQPVTQYQTAGRLQMSKQFANEV